MTIRLLLIFLLSDVFLMAHEISLDSTLDVSPKGQLKHTFKRDDLKNIVIDLNLKYMWQDNIDAKQIRKGLNDAKDYCHKLTLGNFIDWRLPTIEELETIIDHSNLTSVVNSQFKNVKSDYYISASPLLSDIDTISYMDFSQGIKYDGNRKGKAYVRCVRGKQEYKF